MGSCSFFFGPPGLSLLHSHSQQGEQFQFKHQSVAHAAWRARTVKSHTSQCLREAGSRVNWNGLDLSGGSNPELAGQHWLQYDTSSLTHLRVQNWLAEFLTQLTEEGRVLGRGEHASSSQIPQQCPKLPSLALRHPISWDVNLVRLLSRILQSSFMCLSDFPKSLNTYRIKAWIYLLLNTCNEADYLCGIHSEQCQLNEWLQCETWSPISKYVSTRLRWRVLLQRSPFISSSGTDSVDFPLQWMAWDGSPSQERLLALKPQV